MLGPHEASVVQIAAALKESARSSGDDAEAGTYYFAACEKQQRAVDALTAERDAARETHAAQTRHIAESERELAATKERLAVLSERIDGMMRKQTAMQAELLEVRSVQAVQGERYAELLTVGGHATRVQLEEQRRLTERIAPLREQMEELYALGTQEAPGNDAQRTARALL